MILPIWRTVFMVLWASYAAVPVLTQSNPQFLNAMKDLGCFSSGAPLQDRGADQYQSPGACQKLCAGLGKAVMGTTMGSNCWCGDEIPAASNKVSDSVCNTKCQGYGLDMCGGLSAWSVALTGTNYNAAQIGGSFASSSSVSSAVPASTTSSMTTPSSPIPQITATPTPSLTTNQGPSVITQTGTVVVTAPGQTTTAAPIAPVVKSSGPNKAGIAAGVVVGIIVLCAIVGGIFLLLRRRRRKTVEEDYQRNASMTNYTSGAGKSPSAASVSDSRLEPSVMMQRRQSDGSIADNQDYSRRILKVTNPDRL